MPREGHILGLSKNSALRSGTSSAKRDCVACIFGMTPFPTALTGWRTGACKTSFSLTQMVRSRQQRPHPSGVALQLPPPSDIPASCALDPLGISLRRPASTGTIPRNEAKLGPGCKLRADGATCAHPRGCYTQLPLTSQAKTLPTNRSPWG